VPRSSTSRASADAGVKSASRTLDLLEALAKSDRAVAHSVLALRTAIPKSSLTQLLRTLEARAYVESLGPNGPYRLGPSALHLVRHGLDVQRVVVAARASMQQLTADFRTSSGLNVLHGDFVERVHGVTAPDTVGFAMHEGVRAPLYASSSGKLFLAHMKSEELESYLQRVELRPITSRSLKSTGELRREVELARVERAAYSRDEFTTGIVGLSVPLMNAHSRMVAALGLAVPSSDFEARRVSLLAGLQSAALEIAQQMV
jgi:DNA-binding IclR family transcriptional regulator